MSADFRKVSFFYRATSVRRFSESFLFTAQPRSGGSTPDAGVTLLFLRPTTDGRPFKKAPAADSATGRLQRVQGKRFPSIGKNRSMKDRNNTDRFHCVNLERDGGGRNRPAAPTNPLEVALLSRPPAEKSGFFSSPGLSFWRANFAARFPKLAGGHCGRGDEADRVRRASHGQRPLILIFSRRIFCRVC